MYVIRDTCADDHPGGPCLGTPPDLCFLKDAGMKGIAPGSVPGRLRALALTPGFETAQRKAVLSTFLAGGRQKTHWTKGYQSLDKGVAI